MASGKRTTAGDGAASAVAAEARNIVRRAVGDAAGKTVAAQIRQAARHLGYAPDDWRPRELWYGRCASLTVFADLKKRFTAWREHVAAHVYVETGPDRLALATRLGAVRAALVELGHEVDAIAAEVATTVDGARR